ncbi:WXG100 family type VII secretion target [Streptomyces alkaliphilus]|uniref:WXG100 family type VII secretion target n=1 Tax=Streptomyces alkaliphilus TaxID=1472722 RepID=A0A7W3TE51_9ACTN|nr:WXG100 family type VII secretion target [Streptomyces alkaliphilus]MBB0244860.1 WXG100 family type VII secretion target [Streptomyces alkaliphilus]MQS06299.1 WXG100 family type VII secretion target [Streptomyces alkaliphilus]
MSDIGLTYQDMHDAGDHLIAEHERMERELDDLKTYVDNLVEDGYVTAESSKAFQESYEEFSAGVKQTLEGMQGMGNFLHAAADGFEEQDISLKNAIQGN